MIDNSILSLTVEFAVKTLEECTCRILQMNKLEWAIQRRFIWLFYRAADRLEIAGWKHATTKYGDQNHLCGALAVGLLAGSASEKSEQFKPRPAPKSPRRTRTAKPPPNGCLTALSPFYAGGYRHKSCKTPRIATSVIGQYCSKLWQKQVMGLFRVFVSHKTLGME